MATIKEKEKFENHVVLSLDTYDRMQRQISVLTAEKNETDKFLETIMDAIFPVVPVSDIDEDYKDKVSKSIAEMLVDRYPDKVEARVKKRNRLEAARKRVETKKNKEQKGEGT